MTYATAIQLRTRLGGTVFDEIYDDDSESVLSDLEAATAEIDGAIAFRYKLPVTGSGSLALLKDWCLTLAEERAYARPAGSSYTEKVKVRVDQVRKYLDMIRSDSFRLPDAAENNGSSSGGAVSIVQMETPIFGRDKMTGF